MKTQLLILYTIIPLQLFAPNYSSKQQKQNYDVYIQQVKNKQLYSTVIDFIKQSEGLRLNSYLCPANHSTIGYGHKLLKNENIILFTELQADSLLHIDFNKRFEMTSKKLPYNKRLSIAHFIFNCGIGNYNKSNLKHLVDANLPIDTEIIKWSHYLSNGRLIKSKHLLTARLFELKIYKL